MIVDVSPSSRKSTFVTALLSFPYARTSAVDNMARDSAMLAAGSGREVVYWRPYGWTEPAFTFGYSQNWDWVRRNVQPFTGTTIRRITGGGIVDHRDDLTYALSLPAGHSFHHLPALELYRQFHACVVAALRVVGLETVQAPCPSPCNEGPKGATGVCFQKAEPYDVVDPASGLKLAGAAMKRNLHGVLMQGSLAAGRLDSLPVNDFLDAISEYLAHWLELEAPIPADPLPQARVDEAAARFAALSWNQRR
jgi:lipoate-protein ligase A